jgi:hypothetical protein
VTLLLGIAYTLIGVLGFIPPFLQPAAQVAQGPFLGNLLGIFTVNWFHSITHLLIGIAGLLAWRSYTASRTYALVVGIAYAGLAVLGLLSRSVGTLGGLLPLNFADDILHIATAALLLLAYFGAGSRGSVRV